MTADKPLIQAIESILKDNGFGHITVQSTTPVGGGCINDALKVMAGNRPWFVKSNSASFSDMFEKEARGLRLLSDNSTLRIPEVAGTGKTDDGRIVLAMEWIDNGPAQSDYWESFGSRLADMHQLSRDSFGLDHDNYIGSLPQRNRDQQTWAAFFANERIEPQVKRAYDDKRIDDAQRKEMENTYASYSSLFPSEQPAFLHGDLWSGNVMCGPLGEPCLIDPAVYFGHREAELAFTTMFGSFPDAFYNAYEEKWPLTEGFSRRKDLYNLYPLLVHLNLFGSSYLSPVLQTVRKIKKMEEH